MSENRVIFIAWVACGVIGYALTLAHFQRKFNVYGMARRNRWSDMIVSMIMLLAGPLGMLAAFFCVGMLSQFKYGLLLWPLPESKINDRDQPAKGEQP